MSMIQDLVAQVQPIWLFSPTTEQAGGHFFFSEKGEEQMFLQPALLGSSVGWLSRVKDWKTVGWPTGPFLDWVFQPGTEMY